MLIRLTDLPDPGPALAAVGEIFFESSSRTSFASPEERAAFLERWTGYYLRQWRERVLLWREPDGSIAGYLTGCLDSEGAEPLYHAIGSYGLFTDLFEAFPAHLHVNCHARWRGQGIGSRLVERFAADCGAAGLPGLHIVTGEGARNVDFYHRLGFRLRDTRTWAGRRLLFMGRTLSRKGLLR